MPPSSIRTPSSPAERATMIAELLGLVEVQVPGEAEPVAQRRGQQPGPGGGPDQGERGDVERDRGRAGALADHDVDPEVLHREVQHLLGRAGEAVDLVDEDDLALLQRGQHGREVARPLDRGAAGDAQRGAELGRDDHRDRRLAEPGRPRQQHVVRRAAASQGAAQQQGELLADPLLADEVVEPLGPQRALDHPLVAVGQRRDNAVGSVSSLSSHASRRRSSSASSALARASPPLTAPSVTAGTASAARRGARWPRPASGHRSRPRPRRRPRRRRGATSRG